MISKTLSCWSIEHNEVRTFINVFLKNSKFAKMCFLLKHQNCMLYFFHKLSASPWGTWSCMYTRTIKVKNIRSNEYNMPWGEWSGKAAICHLHLLKHQWKTSWGRKSPYHWRNIVWLKAFKIGLGRRQFILFLIRQIDSTTSPRPRDMMAVWVSGAPF